MCFCKIVNYLFFQYATPTSNETGNPLIYYVNKTGHPEMDYTNKLTFMIPRLISVVLV